MKYFKNNSFGVGRKDELPKQNEFKAKFQNKNGTFIQL